ALAGGGIEQHHVGDVDRRLTLDDATGHASLGIRLGVTLDQVDVLHDDAVAGHTHNLTLLALVGAGDDDHLVALADTVHSSALAQVTSGASDTIFMNFSARSSRVTGPKMR